jgi:hypothetical protein
VSGSPKRPSPKRPSPWRAIVRAAAVAALLAAGGGCATPTAYQPSRDGYGYADQQIEADRYVVSFSGNAVTPRRVVETYLLYRAAEVTLASGHDGFIITDRETDASTRYTGWVDSPVYGGFGSGLYGGGGGFGFGVGVGTISAYPTTRYTAQATIVVFSGEKPKDNVQAYDARDVIDRLRPTIAFPPEA